MGESPVDQHLQSDWPISLWVCPILDDVIDDEVTVKVQYDTLEANLTIQKGIEMDVSSAPRPHFDYSIASGLCP